MLVQIGNTDISNWVQESTYIMNRADVYEEWEDANLRTHRNSIRSRVTGEFDLVFFTATDLNSFLTLLRNSSTEGCVIIKVWITNEDSFEELQMFYELNSVKLRSISDDYFYKRFRMTLTER